MSVATAVLVLAAAIAPLRGVPTERVVDPRPSVRAGHVEGFRLPSRHDHRMRGVWVYTPPGYEASRDTAYRLVIAFDGPEYLEDIPLPLMLDTLLAAGKAPPCVAVLIDDSTFAARLDDLANRAWFADYLADEVVPWIQAHWRVAHDPHRVIVTGSSAGGLAAAHAALKRPDRFGNVLSQSGAFWRGNEASNGPPFEWLTSQVARGPRRDVRFWLEVGALETRGTLGGTAPSILDANRRFRDALLAKGYRVEYGEVPNGVHAPESWRVRLARGIVALTTGARE
jgi:enterochelin esterase family protein